MTLEQLEALIAVADRRSFSAAARALDVSKQTVSRRIGELEDELGLSLLLRSTRRVAVSDDGSTLVVGASWDASNASGVGGSETNNSYTGAGAVHVYVRGVGGAYTRQAYIKASNPYPAVYFGRTVSLSADGNTLAVGSEREASGGRGAPWRQRSGHW
mgnify:CR=1 FL=1